MGLESATHVNQLVPTNPVGATDPKSQGDDHLRLIKDVLVRDFVNIGGVVNATHTQLNNLASLAARSVLGTAGGVAAAPAAISSGADGQVLARESGSLVFSANYAMLNAGNVFTANQVIGKSQPRLVLNDTSSVNYGICEYQDNGSSKGYAGMSFSTNGIITGSADGDLVNRADAGGWLFSGNAGTTIHLKLSSAGLVTTPCASAQEVGTRGPQTRGVSASDSTTATDLGNSVTFTGGSGQTFTLDNDVPTNGVVVLVNEHTQPWTIAATGTLNFAGVTGSRTLPPGCMAVAYHRQGGGNWHIAGQLT